jgi:hypothetical protein
MPIMSGRSLAWVAVPLCLAYWASAFFVVSGSYQVCPFWFFILRYQCANYDYLKQILVHGVFWGIYVMLWLVLMRNYLQHLSGWLHQVEQVSEKEISEW